MYSHFERAARAKKITKLVAELDRQYSAAGLHPFRQADLIRRHLQSKWTGEDWVSLAIITGSRPPSGETILAIVEVYEERAGQMQKAS